MRPAACQVVPLVNCLRSRRTMSLQPILARWYAVETPMTPPPTMTTRARAGRSVNVMLSPHPRVIRVESRCAEHRCRAPLALDQKIETPAGSRELRIDRYKREALADPMPIGAGSGDADAAFSIERGLA